jgi:pimeloyl-ACP methyl ester carboxylesterase/outer membrane biosynthesis protein TonB
MPLYGSPGEQISYTVYPSTRDGAPPLVLLHGFTASAASFEANIAGLREHFELIVVELLGHGDSEAPAESAPYGPGPAVQRMLDLFDALGHEKVLLCGHSLGGAVALRLALDAPQRLSGLIIINSMSAAGTPEWREQARPGMLAMAARARAEGTDFMRKTRLYPAASKRLDERSRAMLMRDFDRLSANAVAGTAEALVLDVNSFERLGELAVPTLVVLGDRDAAFVASAPAFVARLPQQLVRTARIEGAGHAANIEQPAQFEAALLAFAAEIGVVPALAKKSNGPAGTMLTLVGAGLVIGGVALVAGAIFLAGRPSDSVPVAAEARSTTAATATPTVVSVVEGTRSAGPGNAAINAASASTSVTAPSNTASPAATPPPATAIPATRPAATPTPVRPTSTPAEADPETPTPLPSATPTPPRATPTRTPAGPVARLSGPDRLEPGQSGTFVDASSPGADVQQRAWSASAPASVIDQSNAAAIVVKFPDAGCYDVSLAVSFRGQPSAFSTSQTVAVGPNTLCQ